MSRLADRILILIITAGLCKAAVGLAAVAVLPAPVEFLMSSNATGIQRWIPHGVSLVLALASVGTFIRRFDCLSLAALWAIGAGAFTTPVLGQLGIAAPVEWLLIPVVLTIVVLSLHPSTAWPFRVQLFGAIAAVATVGLALCIDPLSPAAVVAAALAYTALLAASLSSAWRATTYRRRRST